jgi:hypothetical protein
MEQERRIRERAYAIWEREGRAAGREGEHWREAEREIAEEDRTASADPVTAPAAPSPRDAPAAKPKARGRRAAASADPVTAPEGPAAKPRGRRAPAKPTETEPGAAKPARKRAGAKKAGEGETGPPRARRASAVKSG